VLDKIQNLGDFDRVQLRQIMRLKSHESPRKKGRNTKAQSNNSAAQKHFKKKMKNLLNSLERKEKK
jgi:hypothetical protein